MLITNDDDCEPIFRVRYRDQSTENIHGYWEQYNPLKKSWIRLCSECPRKTCKASKSLCIIHYKKENNTKFNSKNMTKKIKRLGTKKKTKKRKLPAEPISIDSKMEEIVNDENEESSESLGMVISISSSLNKKQLYQVKQFIERFHTDSQPIQLTCLSQPDYIDDTTTHLITDDCGGFTTTLTKEILQACVHHIFISSIKWIALSLEQSSILDHFPYEILRDKKSVKTCRGIKQCRFDKLPVFPSSCIICVECHTGIRSMKMTRNELLDIVELSGATLFDNYIQNRTLIILCNSKKEVLTIKQRNDIRQINENQVYYCKPEFLFDSIVRHEVQLIEKYCW